MAPSGFALDTVPLPGHVGWMEGAQVTWLHQVLLLTLSIYLDMVAGWRGGSGHRAPAGSALDTVPLPGHVGWMDGTQVTGLHQIMLLTLSLYLDM